MRNMSPKHRSPRVALATGAVALLACAAIVSLLSGRLFAVPYTILVDGRPIVNVESLAAAKQVLSEVRLGRAGGVPADSVRFTQSVTLRRAPRSSGFADTPEAEGALEKVTSVEGDLYAIDVDGSPTVAFADRNSAEETLKLLKEHYEDKLQGLNPESTTRESVVIEKRHVGLDKFKSSSQDAVDYLTSTTAPPMEYTMELGDRVVNLSRKYHVSLDELKRLNPDKNLDYLVEGDRLTMQPAKTPITILSKVTVTKAVDVDPPSMGRHRYTVAKSGKRQMQVLTTYENGRKIGEEVISQITTWDRPKDQVASADDQDARPKRHFHHYHHTRKVSAGTSGDEDAH